jgi:hypothetical protein
MSTMLDPQQRNQMERNVERRISAKYSSDGDGSFGEFIYILLILAGWALLIKFALVPLYEKLQQFCWMWGVY